MLYFVVRPRPSFHLLSCSPFSVMFLLHHRISVPRAHPWPFWERAGGEPQPPTREERFSPSDLAPRGKAGIVRFGNIDIELRGKKKRMNEKPDPPPPWHPWPDSRLARSKEQGAGLLRLRNQVPKTQRNAPQCTAIEKPASQSRQAHRPP